MIQILKALNRWLIVKVSYAFSTNACVWIFVIYGLLPLLRIFRPHQDTFLYWSNYVQLVALPLLAVGQKLMAQQMRQETKLFKAEMRATITNEMMEMRKGVGK